VARSSNSVVKLEFVIDRWSGSRRRGVVIARVDKHRGISQGYATVDGAGAGARGAGRRPCVVVPVVSVSVGDQRKTSLVAHVRPSRILHRPVPAALAQGPKESRCSRDARWESWDISRADVVASGRAGVSLS
jgi:hypothetical protein